MTPRQGPRRRHLLTLLVVAMTGLVGVGTTGASYPTFQGTLTVQGSSTVAPGGQLTIGGGGYAPGATITMEAHSSAPVSLGTTTADGTGAFHTTVIVPTSLAPGAHTVTATGAAAGGGTLVLSAPFTVTGPGGALPRTGAPVGVWVLGALLLLAAGSTALLLARRHRA